MHEQLDEYRSRFHALKDEAAAGDRILIKGSRSMRLERLVTALTEGGS